MKRFINKLSVLTTTLLLLVSFVLPQTTLAKPGGSTKSIGTNYTLTIMHTNDTHSRVEMRPRLTTAVKKVRSENSNSILVDAGDVFSGTAYFDKYLGLADLWFMNKIRYDAMTFGNHEFDKGTEVLGNFIKEMTFPMVSTNINLASNSTLSPLFKDEISYQPIGGLIYPAIVKDVNGQKIGIFGLLNGGYSFPPVEFDDHFVKARATVESLKQQGINKIIVLSHLGINIDKQLAANVDGIDVIVGGHSHTALATPSVIEKAEPTIIVQAGGELKYLGVLNVTFDNNGVVIARDGKLLYLGYYAPDPEAQAKVQEFKAGLYQ